MSPALPVLWSPAQQAWLQAMGYTVFHDGEHAAERDAALQLSVAQAAPAAPAEPQRAVATAPERPQRPERANMAPPAATPDPRPAPPRVARPAAPAAAEAPAAPRSPATAGSRQPSVRLPDRLQMALLRASGCNPNDPATQALMDSWPLEQLRRDPAAKRALWPTLRALRRDARR